MTRNQLLGSLLAGFAITAIALTSDAAGGNKSDSKVKAVATASKIDAGGNQTVTITLAIDKGWHIYANPVNHKQEFLNPAKTRITSIKAKSEISDVAVKYPPGTPYIDKDTKDMYDIYAGTVKIEAKLKRASGDASPIDIVIDVQACSGDVCLMPGKVSVKAQ